MFIYLHIFFISLIHAGEISLGHLVLKEDTLQPKERFVFSDFGKEHAPLKNASIEFKIGFYPE